MHRACVESNFGCNSSWMLKQNRPMYLSLAHLPHSRVLLITACLTRGRRHMRAFMYKGVPTHLHGSTAVISYKERGTLIHLFKIWEPDVCRGQDLNEYSTRLYFPASSFSRYSAIRFCWVSLLDEKTERTRTPQNVRLGQVSLKDVYSKGLCRPWVHNSSKCEKSWYVKWNVELHHFIQQVTGWGAALFCPTPEWWHNEKKMPLWF